MTRVVYIDWTIHLLDVRGLKQVGHSEKSGFSCGARGQEEIAKNAEATIEKMIARGDNIVKTSNFDNEEFIWATKSSDPNYVKKHKYDDPELHKFKMNLNFEQRRV